MFKRLYRTTCHGQVVVSMVVVLALASSVAASSFSDDFERADGPIGGWTVNNGDWNIVAGELVGGPPPAGEQECFGGDPAVVLPQNYRLSFDIRWIAPEVPGGVGRHAGVMFNFDQVAGRGGGSGYNLWWIDRASDRGLNLARRDGGAFRHLVVGPGAAAPDAEPPSRWTIEVIGNNIRVYGDGELMIDHVDSTYRGGRFAMWTWNGEGQTVAYDNVVVEGIVLSDDFDRGAVRDWTVNAGAWELVDGTLVSGPASGGGAAGEHQAFAGQPLVELPENYTVSVDWNFLAPEDGLGVGRHASLLLNYNQPGVRWNGAVTGYQVHWIDRAGDRGLNLLRWNEGGGLTALHAGTFDQFPQPPANLRVEVEGETIRVFGDDVLAFEVVDNTFRGGIVGLWNWDGDGNHVEWNNFTVMDGDGAVLFEDDFGPRPIPVTGWTVDAGTWEIADGDNERFIAGPAVAGTEQQAFAGDPPLILPDDVIISFDWNFLAPEEGAPPVGRHASCFVAWNQPGIRWSADTSGYQVHWIDRASDHGLNLLRWDGAAIVALQAGTGDLFAQPPQTIRVEMEGESIRVFGDDVLAIDVVDGTYRGGHFGLWTWDGAGQQVEFDNVLIEGCPVEIVACFDIVTPGPQLTGVPIAFDAGCTLGADTFTWDFGDGNVAAGQAVEHTYDAGGNFTVTLTVEGLAGTETRAEDVLVTERVTEFSDSFDRPDGAVDGWSVAAGGTWAIAGGELVAGPTTGEYWIWAGDPPVISQADVTFEFDFSFLTRGSHGVVGRHGGFQFCASEPTTRSAFSGYFVDWIDRPADRGVRFTRVDNGGFVEIIRGQGAEATADPPTHWKVEVVGENIRVYVDGADEPIIDLVDNTYRGGFFGFWTWAGDQEVAIDNLTVSEVPASSNLAGDANADGSLNIADVLSYVDLQFPGFNLLSSGSEAPCAADAGNLAVLDLDGNGAFDSSDTLFLANFLFNGGAPPVQGTECFAVAASEGCDSSCQ